jgi:hypothetical protein
MGPIRKLRRKRSVVNLAPDMCKKRFYNIGLRGQEILREAVLLLAAQEVKIFGDLVRLEELEKVFLPGDSKSK